MYFKGQNAEAMFEQLDKDHSVRLCAALQLESSSPQVLITKCLLRAQGFLDHSEVQELCKMLGKKMNQSAVQTAMDEMVRLNRSRPADSVAMPLRQRSVLALVAHPVGAPEQKHGGWSAAYRNHHPRTFLSARSRGAASQDTDGNGEVTFVEFKAWWDENGGALPPLATRQD